MANCEDDGHLYGARGICVMCKAAKEPEPTRVPLSCHPAERVSMTYLQWFDISEKNAHLLKAAGDLLEAIDDAVVHVDNPDYAAMSHYVRDEDGPRFQDAVAALEAIVSQVEPSLDQQTRSQKMADAGFGVRPKLCPEIPSWGCTEALHQKLEAQEQNRIEASSEDNCPGDGCGGCSSCSAVNHGSAPADRNPLTEADLRAAIDPKDFASLDTRCSLCDGRGSFWQAADPDGKGVPCPCCTGGCACFNCQDRARGKVAVSDAFERVLR